MNALHTAAPPSYLAHRAGDCAAEMPERSRALPGKMRGMTTWTAPQVTRKQTATAASERETLESFLDFHRQTLLTKCAGLSAWQLKRRSVKPSDLSLLGLVRHLAEVERAWFRRRIAGEDIGFLYATQANMDADFDDADDADAAADFATYTTEVELAREAAAGRPLDETFFHARYQVDLSVRWVYLHMIEEYSRHNGHADLLRQAIDGATGE
jgi:uncharacterized damage-inducible protein DinB